MTGEELREQLAGLTSAIERLEAQLGNSDEHAHQIRFSLTADR